MYRSLTCIKHESRYVNYIFVTRLDDATKLCQFDIDYPFVLKDFEVSHVTHYFYLFHRRPDTRILP